jgi:hypothetical protein
MRGNGNRFMNAVPSTGGRSVRLTKNWERDGLIWRTLATHHKLCSPPIFRD